MNQIYFFKARLNSKFMDQQKKFNEQLSLVCINITINIKRNPKIYNRITVSATTKKQIQAQTKHLVFSHLVLKKQNYQI